jgi:hypothetical protein
MPIIDGSHGPWPLSIIGRWLMVSSQTCGDLWSLPSEDTPSAILNTTIDISFNF